MTLIVMCLAVSSIQASVFTVINSNDTGSGSLREAISLANSASGLDHIEFAIPGAGPHLISLGSALPSISSPIYLDGFSQAGAIVNDDDESISTVLKIGVDGSSGGFPGLILAAGSSGSTIKGIWMHSFNSSSIRIMTGSNDNSISGNILGLNLSGTAVLGDGSGIEIFSNGNQVGSGNEEDMNSISGNSSGPGILLSGVGAYDNEIRGCFIGLAHDGTTILGGIDQGIRVEAGAYDNVLGGRNGADSNRISGTTGAGIVVIGASTQGIEIKSNLVNSTGGIPIDLGGDGLTLNDAGDVDTGPNGLINYPVIQQAYTDTEGACYAQISFQGKPYTYHYINWYLVSSPDASGHGGTSIWLGATGDDTDASGLLPSHYTFGRDDDIPVGSVITCTIRDTDVDNTSELAQNFTTAFGQLKVTNNNDFVNGNTASVIDLINAPGPDGISLREAILASNNNQTTWGSEHILFDIPGPSPHYIQPTSPLPNFLSQITMEGSSEPDYMTGTPAVVIDGSLAGSSNGFNIHWDWCDIEGLSIVNFDGDAIRSIEDNGNIHQTYIGVFPDGITPGPNSGHGIHIVDGMGWDINEEYYSTSVISNNALGGILITGSDSYNIEVKNCHIGTDITGTVNFGGQDNGIEIEDGAHEIKIGTDDNDDRCLISGNSMHGIFVDGGDCYDIEIIGNYLGTDISGNAPLSNGGDGIRMDNAHDNIIGGDTPSEANVLSGNADEGIEINGSLAYGNIISGNMIGIGANGTTAVSNGDDGLAIRAGAYSNTIGGSVSGARNVISFNGDMGILIDVSHDNIIAGNYIGTDITGLLDCGNNESGIYVFNAPDNTIGGATVNERNLISGNTKNGIYLYGALTTGNAIESNVVGLAVSGAPLGNSGNGISLAQCSDNVVGSKSSASGNIISSNIHGLIMTETQGIEVLGNFIGTGLNGLIDRGNTYIGISINNATGVNTIGLDDDYPSPNIAHFRNVLSGNGNVGIYISNSPGQVVSANYIGTDKDGSNPIANDNYGIEIAGTSSNVIIGTDSDGNNDALEGNLISGNNSGMRLTLGVAATGIRISGNFIGTDASGNGPLGNNELGIGVNAGFDGLVIGTNGDNVFDEIEGNVISWNGTVGIRLSGSDYVTIAGNNIGVGADGTTALGNNYENIFISTTSSDNVIGYDSFMSNSNHEVVGNRIMNGNRSGVSISGSNAVRNRISRNSMFNNAALGIDLNNDLVTSNDDGDTDTGDNELMNFPVIQRALLEGSNLRITGYAPAGSEIEFFIADLGPNPIPLPYAQSFGEGQEYKITLVEGSVSDLDAATSFYAEDGTNDSELRTENQFEFLIDAGAYGIAAGDRLTSTAIDANNNTSEFSAVRVVTSIEICGNGIDDDGDGKTDSDDPECLDCDADLITNGHDLDDDNDGVLDNSETLSDLDLDGQIGLGNALPASGTLSLPSGDVDYVSGFPTNECRVFDAGLQGHALLMDNNTTTFRLLRFDFDEPVTNLSFKMTDMDGTEVFDIDVYDESTTVYDLSKEGILSIGSNISQSASGRRYTASSISGNIDGDDPAFDQFGSVVFHFPGKVKSVVFSISLNFGSSLRLTEMTYNLIDTDDDGILDPCDLDSDNDGIYDAVESGSSMSQSAGVLSGGVDADGIPLSVSNGASGVNYIYSDADTNGVLNPYDLDSDGDSCNDVIEAGFPDSDGDGQLGGLVPPSVDVDGKVTSGGL